MLTGKLILIVGPSGSGKGTVIGRLKSKYAGFVYPVSFTTREMRLRERDGEVYKFVSREEFERMIAAGELLEYATVHSDNYYGTAKAEIMNGLESGAMVLREVDIQGFHSIREVVPAENLVSIFMKVSDLEDLKQRILRRGQISDDELAKRLNSAKMELDLASECDYQVENKWGDVEGCLSEVEKIILAEIEKMIL